MSETPLEVPGLVIEASRTELLPTHRERLAWVDAARGIAALSVTVYHFQIGTILAHATHLPWLVWINWAGSRLAVPLFFVISGFSIHYAEHHKIGAWTQRPAVLGHYFSRRLWRIYPPYCAALLLAVGVGWVQGNSFPIGDLSAHLLMVHQFFPAYFNSINVVLWSIGVEIWLYLIYPFALQLLERRGLRAAGTTLFFVSAVSIGATAVASPVPNVVGLWFVLNLFFGWFMGAAVAEGFIKGNDFFLSVQWWIVGVALLVLHLALYFCGVFAGRLWPAFIPSVVVLSAWGLSFLMFLERRRAVTMRRKDPFLNLLRWLGTISYSLYLVHEPLINLRDTVLQWIPNHAVDRVVFGIWYIVPFAAAWLCWRWVEKPSMRISKRLKAALA